MPAATNPLPQLIPARVQKARQRIELLIKPVSPSRSRLA